MPKDYASRKASGKQRGGTARALAGLRGFSARSFGGGALFGAALTLALIHGPGLIPAVGGGAQADVAGDPAKPPALTYEFMDLLPNEEVVTGVTPFAEPDINAPSVGAEETPAAVAATDLAAPVELAADSPGKEYLLQAASFRSRDEADTLRAELLLDGMTAAVSAVSSTGGAWHRVVVGPFSTKVEMERTLTTLRSKDLAALPVAHTP